MEQNIQIFNNLKIQEPLTISSTEMYQFDIESSNIQKIYNKSEKKIIASRIEQINNKKIYLKIFQVISNDNNNYTSTSNGIWFNLNGLENHTLAKIEQVLDIYDSIKKNKTINNNWSHLLQNQYNKTDNDTIENKLSNREKIFLKRQQNINENEITYWGCN